MNLLGLDFADLDLEAAAAMIERRGPGVPFRYVVTPNADHLVRLHRRPELRGAYQRAMLRLLDSRVVARAAHALGLPSPPVVTGSDLAARLLARLPRGERIAIVGMREPAVASLAHRCGIAEPLHYDPPMGFASDPAEMDRAVRFVLDSRARLAFIAVGSPRQELLAAAIQATGEASGTALCIGAGLDFLAGSARRAPRWMQQAGLEWLFRLAAEPNRLARRYLYDDPPIFGLLLRERLRPALAIPAHSADPVALRNAP